MSEMPLAERYLNLLLDLIRTPSLSGSEKEALDFFVKFCEQETSFKVEKIPNPNSNQNYLIFISPDGSPVDIIFTTHMDVVPAKEELFQPKIEGDRIYGRGACDAKGILVSMFAAYEELVSKGASNLGFLVVFEEETHASGAILAGEILKDREIKYIVNGEPTENCTASGHKGVLGLELEIFGRNAHSGYPELGVDANRALLDLGQKLYNTNFDQGFSGKQVGNSTINIGKIIGGSAHNVISDYAKIQILIRVASSAENCLKMLNSTVTEFFNQQSKDLTYKIQVLSSDDPISLESIEGLDSKVFSYFTDLPHLVKMGGKGILCGPGKLDRAHTDFEYITIPEMLSAIETYQKIYLNLNQKV